MSKSLVIVESPAKAKTISKFLGSNFVVLPSMGHLIDLPENKIGVDVEHDFKPEFKVVTGRTKVLAMLRKEAKDKSKIYLATDPDREGEAISWHIRNNLGGNKKKKKEFLRVVFHEITPEAINNAFKHPTDIDLNKVNSQQARRILDRIVGYFLSPLLWKKIARGLSAGRVQSIALRLIVERERQILSFVPKEYWEIEAELEKTGNLDKAENSFVAKLEKKNNERIEIKDKESTDVIVADLKNKKFTVAAINEKHIKKNPQAPFITSTLQQEAFNKLGFNANRTMMIAQQLYEGIELGKAGPVGLITYMRTDSTQVSQDAIKRVRNFILKDFGKEYLPATPNVYKSRKSAQEAHEAIRPTSIERQPEAVKGFLTPEQLKLYQLIYNRFLASQMKPALFLSTSVDILAGEYLFKVTGSVMLFAGFTICYNNNKEKEKSDLPRLIKDEVLKLINLSGSQHFTKPPPRFSEASLVKMLEEEGIGRPSTYAPIIQTIVSRNYVTRQKGYIFPSELGIMVCDMLVANFSKVMDVKFTAKMEDRLDAVEEGRVEWIKILHDFYGPFKKDLEKADKAIKKEVVKTDQLCELCSRPMIIKWGRRGKFLSCSGFPECKNAKSITTGIKCPAPGCSGELIERHSRRGSFYGCSSFPNCRYITNELPEPKPEDSGSSGKPLSD